MVNWNTQRITAAMLFVWPMLVCAATPDTPVSSWSVRELKAPAPANSRQHRLANTADGRLLLSWVEGAENTASSLCFAVREGQGWSVPRTVQQFTEKLADAPQILALTDGALAAAWMISRATPDNPYAADLYLAHSRDGGASWGAPIKPYGQQARIYDAQMSFSVLPAGKLALVWTDKRDLAQRKTAAHDGDDKGSYQLMATVVDSEGRSTPEKRLDGDVCPCCSVGSAASDENILTVYRDHLPGEVRDIARVLWSADSLTSTRLVHDEGYVIDGCPSNGPAVDRHGPRAVVAWYSNAGGKGHVQAAFSRDGGVNFDRPLDLEPEIAIGYVDALLLDDGSAVVSWRARVPAGSDQSLKVARITPDGSITRQTTVHTGSFPRWPSAYPKMKRTGSEIFIAWTDAVKKQVRVASFDLGAK